jgi:hypothetical protein
MNDKQSALAAWYNEHISAGWYASAAMWLGILGTMFLPLLENIQPLMDSYFPAIAEALKLSPLERILYPALIAALIPPAKAWRQKWMQAKALKQAALAGNVSTRVGTDSVIIAVPGTAVEVVRAMDQTPVRAALE